MDASFSAEEHFTEGQSELARDRIDAALDHFRAAHRLDPTSPRYRSYFGLCLGLAERRFDRALELCRSAAKEEFFNPALYHNLAKLHHPQLPIAHRHPLVGGSIGWQAGVAECFRSGGG